MPVSTYETILVGVFQKRYVPGSLSVEFTREDLIQYAEEAGVGIPKNIGDLIYSYRFRKPIPQQISALAPDGKQWVIRLAGAAKYRFDVVEWTSPTPTPNMIVIKVPDATPSIIAANVFTDEQALLAKLRYNRLIDLFLRTTCYSLQNHLRTQLESIGQIEIDELYLGVTQSGAQLIIPIQAKGKSDKMGLVQIEQDIAFCQERFPNLICSPIGAQFLKNDIIVLMLFAEQDGNIVIQCEKHYKLVSSTDITPSDLETYRRLHEL